MCLNVTTFCAELGATSRDETIARPGLLEHIVEGLHVVARDERAGENHLRSFQPPQRFRVIDGDAVWQAACV